MELKEEINKRRKDKWFEVAFGIEVLAVKEDVAGDSLNKHVNKLSKEPWVFVYEKKFSEIQRVENPMKNVELAYSQIVSLKLFVKNLSTLLHIVMLYGPSSIEVLGPNKKEVELGEIQHVANNLASIVHQFAAAGVGGIVITPEKK
jgi:hypothetical protein